MQAIHKKLAANRCWPKSNRKKKTKSTTGAGLMLSLVMKHFLYSINLHNYFDLLTLLPNQFQFLSFECAARTSQKSLSLTNVIIEIN